jgi:hypothetical protein
MTLDDILAKHIPIPPGICKVKRAKLEQDRWKAKERIAFQRELHLVPEKILKDVEKTFGKLK